MSDPSVLKTLIHQLRDYLLDPKTTELIINRPGDAFVETAGAWHRLPGEDFSKRKIDPIITAINSFAGGNLVGPNASALLSTTLPTGERIQIVTQPVVEDFALAIRKPGTVQLTLDDYQAQGAFSALTSPPLPAPDHDLKNLLANGDIRSFLEQCVIARKTIVISGGTSTGKTTFFNALAQIIPVEERLITIEDAREINLLQVNKLHLLTQRGSNKNSFLELLETCLRLRPDRILAAELRGAEAFTFLRSVNTGHPGSMTTIHANSTQAAIEQLKLMVAQAQLGLEPNLIENYIQQTVDVILQLERNRDGNRVVTEIRFLGKTFKGGKYTTDY